MTAASTSCTRRSWHLLSCSTRPPASSPGRHARRSGRRGPPDRRRHGRPEVLERAGAFQETHPERFLQFGISEQNMVSAAAGSRRPASALRRDVRLVPRASCAASRSAPTSPYTELPVRLIGHHAGIALGFYGTSHHATEDLAIMRSIAGLTVVAPADAAAARRGAPRHRRSPGTDLLPHRARPGSGRLRRRRLRFTARQRIVHAARRRPHDRRHGLDGASRARRRPATLRPGAVRRRRRHAHGQAARPRPRSSSRRRPAGVS